MASPLRIEGRFEPAAIPVVYIVDDDEAVRDSLGLLLESHGFSFEAFDSAKEFMRSYRKGKPGCLVLDMQMPVMNGIEMLERLGPGGLDMPVIMISGHADAALVARALQAGVSKVIDKPFRDHELLSAIRDSLSP
jgi:FixJ family two-component response regulator